MSVRFDREYYEMWGVRWRYGEGGRQGSHRPREHHDCTVRALAITTGASYDTVATILRRAGRRWGRRFDLVDFLGAERLVAGRRLVRVARIRGRGRYVVVSPDHAWAVVDGVHVDEHPVFSPDVVIDAWRVVPRPRDWRDLPLFRWAESTA